MNKTDRKNNKTVNVNWPNQDVIFSVDELHSANLDMPLITLRVRLNKAREDNKVHTLGTKSVGKGRPKLMFVMSPASTDIIEKAKSMDIIPLDKNGSLTNNNSITDQIPVTVNENQVVNA